MDMKMHEIAQQPVDLRDVRFCGRILDVGGGGEAVISRHSGDRVVAIDRSKRELEETPDIGLKIVMDACQMSFLDSSFETITCFFLLMYMDMESIGRFLAEAHRVLKPGGSLWVWDVTVPAEATAEIFVVPLRIQVSADEIVETGYGMKWNRGQSSAMLRQCCEEAGFRTVSETANGETFLLKFEKTV